MVNLYAFTLFIVCYIRDFTFDHGIKHALFTGHDMLKMLAIHYRSVNSCQSVWRTVCGFEFVTRLQPDTTFKHPTKNLKNGYKMASLFHPGKVPKRFKYLFFQELNHFRSKTGLWNEPITKERHRGSTSIKDTFWDVGVWRNWRTTWP